MIPQGRPDDLTFAVDKTKESLKSQGGWLQAVGDRDSTKKRIKRKRVKDLKGTTLNHGVV